MHISTSTSAAAYASRASYGAAASTPDTSAARDGETGQGTDEGAHGATVVTVSDAARAAYAASETDDFADVVRAARALLNELLEDAERASPLQDEQLALDMGKLDQRQLHAISTTDDGLFTSDERAAADLELERRWTAALDGPAAVSEVTGDYRTLYKAAAEYLDAQSSEQRAEPEWAEAREAIATALEKLSLDPETAPQDIANDPVADYLVARAPAGEEAGAEPETLAEVIRAILDERYAEAEAAGRNPTLDPASRTGQLVSLADFEARALTEIVNNEDGTFSAQEVRVAQSELRARGSATLYAAFGNAAESGDPTAFARNVMAAYASMSPQERAAAGWNENLLNAAAASYETTVTLMQAFASADFGGGQTSTSWFSG